MKTLKSWRLVALANLAFGVGCVAFVACTGDDSGGITPPGTDSGTAKDTSVPPASDTGTADTGTDTSVNPQGEPPGCFTGSPVNSLDFQNACTTSAYVVFDNCARIGYCAGDTLPALVTPPVDAGADTGPADTGPADTGVDAADSSADAAGG